MVDISAAASRTYGMITDPQATLAYNSQPVPSWWIVAKEHVLPVLAVSLVIHGILTVALQPVYEAAYRAAGLDMPEPGYLIFDLGVRFAFQFAGIAAWAAVVGYFAGVLGGRNDFNAAYVLVALALTPHMISTAVLPIPAIGQLAWLVTFIYAMVILYKGAPALVGVPDESRARHMLLSLVSMIMAAIVVALVFGPLVARTGATPG